MPDQELLQILRGNNRIQTCRKTRRLVMCPGRPIALFAEFRPNNINQYRPNRFRRGEVPPMAWYAYCITELQAFQGTTRTRRPFPVEGLKDIGVPQTFGYPTREFAFIVPEQIPPRLHPPKPLCPPPHRL